MFRHILKLIRVGVWFLCNVVLVSAGQQSESAVGMPHEFGFPSHVSYHRALGEFPVCSAVGSHWLSFILVLYTSLTSQFITPPLPSMVSILLFSMSVSLLLL